jgi:pimeloyl-ACP methyl ester carboxylesterase
MRNPFTQRIIFLLLSSLCILVIGCAGVKVVSISSTDYMQLRRGDVLTTGELSVYTGAALQVVGIGKDICDDEGSVCREALVKTIGLRNEQRLSALAELWLQEAISLDKQFGGSEHIEAILSAYLETARHSYAYLFMTGRTTGMRALEDRTTQVRDYYNYAVQKALTTLFEYYRRLSPADVDLDQDAHLHYGNWNLTIRSEELRLADKRRLPDDLIPATLLSFAGLRNQYKRDGLGAELVALTSRSVVGMKSTEVPYSETPFPAVTAVMSFPGANLKEVLATRNVVITGYDPYSRESIKLAGAEVPLAANFTSGDGLWLARSGFAAQSLLTLIGKGDVLEMPRVYLMQPYNPNRHIVIMLHGLASSPEAWINLANEVLGDETLRQNYQIWQIYYPTNVPIAFNNYEINKAIRETLAHFDPAGRARASRKILIIGHSMGGILSRLMVSSSGDRLWDAFLKKYPLEGWRLDRVRKELGPYMTFEPLSQVSRVIFVATPHKGTPVAEFAPVRWISRFITLPFSVLNRFREIAQILIDPGSANPVSLTRSFNSIDNLSHHDPFIQIAAELPISSRVRYHSIIGNDTPKVSLSDSSDGVVPYTSSHLEGVESEKVISSGHSVQEMPEAIIEIRRIMHLHLKESDKK